MYMYRFYVFHWEYLILNLHMCGNIEYHVKVSSHKATSHISNQYAWLDKYAYVAFLLIAERTVSARGKRLTAF